MSIVPIRMGSQGEYEQKNRGYETLGDFAVHLAEFKRRVTPPFSSISGVMKTIFLPPPRERRGIPAFAGRMA